MGIFDASPKTGVLSGGASSYSNTPSKGIAVSNSENQDRVIIYKTENIVVLQKTEELKFITTFDDVTKEGYRLMAIDSGRFYFQKMKI